MAGRAIKETRSLMMVSVDEQNVMFISEPSGNTKGRSKLQFAIIEYGDDQILAHLVRKLQAAVCGEKINQPSLGGW